MAGMTKAPFWDMEDCLGSYLAEIAHSKPLSPADEVNLARKIKQGDEHARNRLVEANLRFVVSVAKEYQNRGVPLADLVVLEMGLITAAERCWTKNKGQIHTTRFGSPGILQTLPSSRRRSACRLNKIAGTRYQGVPHLAQEALMIPTELSWGSMYRKRKETLMCGRSMRSLDAAFLVKKITACSTCCQTNARVPENQVMRGVEAD